VCATAFLGNKLHTFEVFDDKKKVGAFFAFFCYKILYSIKELQKESCCFLRIFVVSKLYAFTELQNAVQMPKFL
jgi:hypothetical protein